MKRLGEFIIPFGLALAGQLIEDEKRWGETWRYRPVEANDKFHHQVDRAYLRFQDYYSQWKRGGIPIPWLKIAGECLICWVRENYPEELVPEVIDAE